MARARLFWERYAPVFAIAAIVFSLFLIGSFGGIWERIGDPWRGIALIAALYFIGKAALGARGVKRPTRSEARRRVERDSGVKHRPLDTLDDRPALSEKLWPAHYAAARNAAEHLDAPLPRPVLAPMDQYFLRFLLPAALVLAALVGAGDNMERLKRALTPTWQSPISAKDVTFEAWVDPPDYTGRPPIYFKDRTQVDIPAGSELVARITGAKDATRLKLKGKLRSRYLPLTRLGPKSFETRAIINGDTTARWRVGSFEKSWDLTAIPDTPPTVAFKINPRADKRDRLAFTYSFKDDYGVQILTLDVQRLTDEPVDNPVIDRINVPLPGYSVREADYDTAALNLIKHKWAGQKVSARLTAHDGLGQTAQSDIVYFTVPDKIFIEPIAKAVAEHRRLVLQGQTEYTPLPPRVPEKHKSKQPVFDTFESEYRLGRAHPSVQRAVDLIEAATDLPQGLYEDPAVFMGLKTTLSQLRYARSLEDISHVPDDLWRIALRAEFGILGSALEEMREAAKALRDGIARRAPQREIDTLFERYSEAVDNYMDELRRKAMEDGNIAQNDSGGGGGRNTDEIKELQKAIAEANRIGDTEGARRGLEKLTELLENMQIQLSMSPGGGGDGEPMEGEMSEEMKKALEEMADLLGEQRELKDETEQAQRNNEGGEGTGQNPEGDRQQGQSGEASPEDPDGGQTAENPEGGSDGDQQNEGALSPGELAARQRALERSLEGLADAIPEPDENGDDGAGAMGGEENEDGNGGQSPDEALADAQRAMGESESALQGGDLDGAARAQSEAIDALRRAGLGLIERAERARGEDRDAQNGENTDPLGRENGGDVDEGAETDIDQRDNATRSRELLEELRRRAAEQEREKQEREYLERLLKRF